jgi:hypothetical protein
VVSSHAVVRREITKQNRQGKGSTSKTQSMQQLAICTDAQMFGMLLSKRAKTPHSQTLGSLKPPVPATSTLETRLPARSVLGSAMGLTV